MKKLEKIFGLIAIIALIIRFFLFTIIPGNGLLTTIAWLILAIMYYPLGFLFFNQISFRNTFKKKSYKGISSLRIIGAVVFGMSLSTICIGILFKLMAWPLANQYLIAGLILTTVLMIIVVIKYLKNKDSYYLRMIYRYIIIGGFGLFILNVSYISMTKFQFRNHPEYIKAYIKHLEDPDNEILRKNLEMEYIRTTMSKEDFELHKEYMENKD